QRPGLASGVVGAGGSTLSRQVLRLPIGEDANAVSVGGVVSDPDPLDLVRLLPYVMPRAPRTGAAGELAVAKMEALLQGAEIRLPTGSQSAAGGAGFEVGISDGAGHDQLLSNIRGGTVLDTHGPENEESQG